MSNQDRIETGDSRSGSATGPKGGRESALRIKNMVCDRCIMSVEDLLAGEGFEIKKIRLGEAVVLPEPDTDQMARLKQLLEDKGFELVQDRRDGIVTSIKSELINWMKQVESDTGTWNKGTQQEKDPQPLSDYLAKKLHRSYPTLSRTFSSLEGITIEKYLIRMRIERVKELLSYGDLTLSQIAWQLGYSSVQHLSAQFKSVTGMSVTEYKESHTGSRRKLDAIE